MYKEKFEQVFAVVKKYISLTLKTKRQINEYVPNSHIAMVFKEVIQACEKESMYPDIYHNIKKTAYDYVKPELRHEYDYIDGRYHSKQTYKISFLDIIDEYFDESKLKENGIEEIHIVYQKLRGKYDTIRNNLKLINIVIPSEYNMEHKVKENLISDKIKINY